MEKIYLTEHQTNNCTQHFDPNIITVADIESAGNILSLL